MRPCRSPATSTTFPYQLNQLAEVLRRNQIHSARLDTLNAHADLARQVARTLKLEELESLLGLAALLDAAGTADQKQALATVIQQKLDQVLPATLRTYPPGTTLVFATPGFPWAADQVAGVLGGQSPAAVEASLSDVRRIALESTNVVGYVEVQVNVYQAYETVKAICYRPAGEEVWSKRRLLNAGGGPETLAREMVGRLLKKVRGLTCR